MGILVLLGKLQHREADRIVWSETLFLLAAHFEASVVLPATLIAMQATDLVFCYGMKGWETAVFMRSLRKVKKPNSRLVGL